MIFFALDHKYTKKSLSFSGLKGQDRLLAQLLQSCSFLDVHLSIVVQRISGGYDPDDGHEEVHERSFDLCHLINSINIPIELPGLEIDYKTQLIGESSRFLKPKDPIREEEDQMGNEATSVERWYHQAVLIAWPKYRTSRIYLKYNFDSILALLEGQVISKQELVNKEESIEELRKLLKFCIWNGSASSDSDRAYRLLILCTYLKARPEGLSLLDVFGKKEGICDDRVAEAIAEFECRVAGNLVFFMRVHLINFLNSVF